ncbi:IQ domain-containing protein N [Theristicus caerulescens]
MMWTHKATHSANSGKHYKEQMPSNAGRNRDCRPHPISDKAFDFAMVSPRESPTLPCQIQRLQKESLSATMIQAVWWGYRVRRDVDEMNKAAARIQAAYRGHRTRQELPFGFYDCLGDKKPALNQKEKAEKRTTALPLVMEHCGCWDKGSQTPGVTTENERPRGQHRDRHEQGTSVIPGPVVSKTEFSLTPCKVLTLSNSLLIPEVFQALTSEQQAHDAADSIWAVRNTYQSRDDLDKMERQADIIAEPGPIFMSGYQLRRNSGENYHISELASVTKMQELTIEPQDKVPHPERDLTVKLELKKENKESNAEGNAPSVRNIDVHTVVKSLCTSKRSISLRVSSPNGAVEGFYRETGSGQLHGLYTVRQHGDSKLSQVCIHVNVVEMGRGQAGVHHGTKAPRKCRTGMALVVQNLVPILAEPGHR